MILIYILLTGNFPKRKGTKGPTQKLRRERFQILTQISENLMMVLMMSSWGMRKTEKDWKK